jgi:hypothetical protein
MLGQLCHSELLDKLDNQYQESFVIHARDTTITLFYARLPNHYLARVSQHGAKYASAFSEKVQLYQIEAFSMDEVQDQAELYVLLSKLLWYLVSGDSHVGLLSNCPGNPFNEVFLFISITDVWRTMIGMKTTLKGSLSKNWQDK